MNYWPFVGVSGTKTKEKPIPYFQRYNNLQSKIMKIIGETIPKLTDKYRNVKPDIDESDYYICTIAEFKNTGMSEAEFDKLKAPEVKSDSGSRYKVINGSVYRLSDHWGRVASCEWEIDYSKWIGKDVGVVKISDMKPNYYCQYILTPKGAKKSGEEAIKKIESLRGEVSGAKAEKLINENIERVKSLMKKYIKD
jgi:hypothetical protein